MPWALYGVAWKADHMPSIYSFFPCGFGEDPVIPVLEMYSISLVKVQAKNCIFQPCSIIFSQGSALLDWAWFSSKRVMLKAIVYAGAHIYCLPHLICCSKCIHFLTIYSTSAIFGKTHMTDFYGGWGCGTPLFCCWLSPPHTKREERIGNPTIKLSSFPSIHINSSAYQSHTRYCETVLKKPHIDLLIFSQSDPNTPWHLNNIGAYYNYIVHNYIGITTKTPKPAVLWILTMVLCALHKGNHIHVPIYMYDFAIPVQSTPPQYDSWASQPWFCPALKYFISKAVLAHPLAPTSNIQIIKHPKHPKLT